jgi:hypothetical protein
MRETIMNMDRDHNITAAHDSMGRVYPQDLQPLLQSLLSTLTNLDFEYDREREKLSRTITDVNLKIRVLEKLKQKHRERREPYIQQLALLQDRIHRQWN